MKAETIIRLGRMAVALSVAGFAVGCGGESSTATPSAGPSDAASGLALASDVKATIGLVVQEVRPTPFSFAVTAPGKIRANQEKVALVGPMIEGRIGRIFVTWGDAVTAGEVLAYLESLDVGEAKAAYFTAMAQLQVAEASLRRRRLLFDEQIISQKDLLETEAAYTSAQAEADAAEKALHVIGFTEEEVASLSESHDLTATMPIVAPISGTIVDRQAMIGALAEPSGELFTIMDLRTLWVDAEVYEKDLDKVRSGQRVEISVIAYPEEHFSGRVSYIGDTLDEETRTTVVRTLVANPRNRLKPGMFATVRIVTMEKPEALVLPEGTVLREGGKTLVVVEEDAQYRLREVRLGRTADGIIEIVTGLDSGDRVVTSGHYQIATKILSRTD